jgi:glycosyltransferase involved in cell wall biosynthesis
VRIGISFAALTNRGGIGRYARLLVINLPKLFPKHQYTAYIPAFREDETLRVIADEGIEGWNTVFVPGGNRWAYETTGLPGVLKSESPDIFHGPDYLAPDAPCPVSVTVHDLAFRLHPVGMALKSRILFRFLTPPSIRRAEKSGVVFCDSRSTLDDLKKLRWISQDKGNVVHLACEDSLREPVPEEEIQAVLDRYGITRSFVLYAGPVEHRKNLAVLIESYKLVVKVLKRRGDDVPPLIATGHLGAGGEKLRRTLEGASEGRFHYLGYVDRDVLKTLYYGCTLFCYPSRYEGFGLPPLEAMTCGKAVVVSNATSLPEVVGDAGVLVDPDNVQGWSTAILRLITDDKFRHEHEEACLERSREFSVKKMCSEMMAAWTGMVGR